MILGRLIATRIRPLRQISSRRLYSTSFNSLEQELSSRGFVARVTNDALFNPKSGPLTVYCGVDPTAPSLHAGNLLALLGLLHFQLRGHQVISLIGGATGSIGDPGGRSTERKLLPREELEFNVEQITEQVHLFFNRADEYARKRLPSLDEPLPPKVLNNLDWLSGVQLLDFLRDVGKHAKVNVMITRDSVKTRLSSEHGISFTEFSYQLLQAYDFYMLHKEHGCQVQIGGSDQWGNIVAGIDLIKRRRAESEGTSDAPPPPVVHRPPQSESDSMPEETIEEPEIIAGPDPAYGLTIPLLTTPSGEKFGKSAGNALWLDERMTSVFDFYQFFMRTPDSGIHLLLTKFTLLSLEEIQAIMTKHEAQPELRLAQRTLASEVTELVHGVSGVQRAQAATKALFDTDLSDLCADDVINAMGHDPRLVTISDPSELLDQQITKLTTKFKLTASRGAARQLLASGGLYLNNERLGPDDKVLQASDLIDGRLAILRAGKDKHVIAALQEPIH